MVICKLIPFEIKKVAGSKIVVSSVLVLLLLNVFITYYFSAQVDDVPYESYRKFTQNIIDMTEEQKSQYINSLYTRLSVYDEISDLEKSMLRTDFSQKKVDISLKISKLKEIAGDDVSDFSDLCTYTAYVKTELAFIEKIKEEFEQVYEYPRFLQKIVDDSRTLDAIDIFNQNEYQKCERETTLKLYNRLQNVRTVYLPQKGIQTFLEPASTDYLMLICVFLLAVVSARMERENGTYKIIRCTKYGRTQTAAAKVIALAIETLLIALLFFASNLVLCKLMFGTFKLDRSVQSVSFLMGCSYNGSLATYMLCLFLYKWMALSLFCIAVFFISSVPKKAFYGYVLSACYCILCLMQWLLIPANSNISLLKYLNPIGALFANAYFRDLLLFNILDKPVPLYFIVLTYILALFAIFSLLFVCYFSKLKLETERFELNISKCKKPDFLNKCSLFMFESKKLFLSVGALWILIMFVAVYIYQCCVFDTKLPYDEAYYRYYMQSVEGVYGTEQYRWLESESEKFRPIYEADEMYKSHEITFEEYSSLQNSLSELYSEYQAFTKVINKVDSALENSHTGIVYETGYNMLFGFEKKDDARQSAMAIFFLIFSISGIFPYEYTSGVYCLISSTPRGHEETVEAKYSATTIVVICITALSWISAVYQCSKKFGLGCWMMPINSLPVYATISFEIPIALWLLILIAVRYHLISMVRYVILWISVLTQKNPLTICWCIAIFLLPILFYSSGYGIFEYLGLNVVYNFGYYIVKQPIISILMISVVSIWGIYTKKMILKMF